MWMDRFWGISPLAEGADSSRTKAVLSFLEGEIQCLPKNILSASSEVIGGPFWACANHCAATRDIWRFLWDSADRCSSQERLQHLMRSKRWELVPGVTQLKNTQMEPEKSVLWHLFLRKQLPCLNQRETCKEQINISSEDKGKKFGLPTSCI